MKSYIVFLFCFKIIDAFGEEPDATIVTLPNGQIRGHILQTPNNKSYYAFQEIPYASPPIGKLRFMEPQIKEPWTGILNTTQNTKICYRFGSSYFGPSQTPNVTETEDCLYLNVYTPTKPGNTSATLLPVLFYIHGGAFSLGDGTFQTNGPQYFIDADLVVVTINYRVGAFGFLTTNDGVIPGNNGLRDQNFALKWTNDNIELFGGDASKITIGGESAGAYSVGHHIISKKSKGLFRGAIMESGTTLGCTGHQSFAKYFAYEMGKRLDSEFTEQNSSQELLTLLQKANASDIVNVSIPVPNYAVNDVTPISSLAWSPVIEDETYENAFLVGSMHENLRLGNFNQVPILNGFNSEEDLLFQFLGLESAESQATYFEEDLSRLISNQFNMTDENKLKAGIELRNIYTNGSFQNNLGAVVRFMSDQRFTTPTIRHAYLQSNYTPVYMYEFSYDGPLGGINETIAGAETVAHAEELNYMWNPPKSPPLESYPESDILTHNRLMKLWTNFIKYQNPTPEADPLLEETVWETVSPDNLIYLNINATLELRKNPKQYNKLAPIFDKYAIQPYVCY